jgi:hypothetical protein
MNNCYSPKTTPETTPSAARKPQAAAKPGPTSGYTSKSYRQNRQKPSLKRAKTAAVPPDKTSAPPIFFSNISNHK